MRNKGSARRYKTRYSIVNDPKNLGKYSVREVITEKTRDDYDR